MFLLAGCFGASGNPAWKTDASALQIPVLSPAPELDNKVSPEEWSNTLLIQDSFHIQDGTAASGDYPFELRLGHDDNWLFALAKVRVPLPNPFDDTPQKGVKHPWDFNMFLDSKLAPGLVSPEAWKGFQSFGSTGSITLDGFWAGTDWKGQEEGGDTQHLPWVGQRPSSGTWGRGWIEGNDLLWEIYIPLHSPNTVHEGFQASPGSVFRLALMFDVEGTMSPDARGFFADPQDGYPGDGYTPKNYFDPSSWMRLQLA